MGLRIIENKFFMFQSIEIYGQKKKENDIPQNPC